MSLRGGGGGNKKARVGTPPLGKAICMCDEGEWFWAGSGLGTSSPEETEMFPHVGGQR